MNKVKVFQLNQERKRRDCVETPPQTFLFGVSSANRTCFRTQILCTLRTTRTAETGFKDEPVYVSLENEIAFDFAPASRNFAPWGNGLDSARSCQPSPRMQRNRLKSRR